MDIEENLTQKAINLALKCNWKEAIKTNLQILDSKQDDTEVLNRLAYAYYQNGQANKAKITSKKVLKINPSDKIAKNALAKYESNLTPNINQRNSTFIEESGKTKLTSLINLGSEKTCTSLSAGDEVFFAPHAHKVSVITAKGVYIGKLTDDLSARVRMSLNKKGKFLIFVKSANKNCIKIFIKGNSIVFPIEASESVGEFSS